MKIEIITFHDTSNFGATLQCAALTRYLSKSGHEVEVINYLPQYVLNKKSAGKELRKVAASKNKVKAFVKGILYASNSGRIQRREQCFEEFISENLTLSKVYHSFDEIKADPPAADLYICGSDQIWNPGLTGGRFDKAFFLQFCHGKKASYGASLGEYVIDEKIDEFRQMTDDYLGVSVRESSMADHLSEVLGREVQAVLDCTLLLDRTDYGAMEKSFPLPNTPYLLLYNMHRSEVSNQIARNIAEEKGLSVVNISPNPFIKVKGAGNLIDIGPGEFLSLFKNADYIVTNSFHGTVFSIIYEKQFISVPHSTRSGRVLDLLNMLGLEDRLAGSVEEAQAAPVDYRDVREALKRKRMGSYDYLHGIITMADEGK